METTWVKWAVLAALTLTVPASRVMGQEGVFLTEEQAPRAVFPDADRFERKDVTLTDTLRERLKATLDGTTPSIWEPRYVTFDAFRASQLLGRAFIVEEIGKHRPITFVVGIRPDGHIQDVAVMAYREAYGGEVRNKRFLVQYRGKDLADSVQPYQAITNIAGATLSVEAASRAVKKALALARVTADGSHQ
jgi:FMN-binding domain